jgi:hypothetical protein
MSELIFAKPILSLPSEYPNLSWELNVTDQHTIIGFASKYQLSVYEEV